MLYQPPLVDRGYGLIYDVERGITWLKDANYAKTLGRSSDGQLSWYAATDWVASLSVHGIDGWRLPSALDPGETTPYVGQGCTKGELGHLFYVGSQVPGDSVTADNFDSSAIYWTSTEASAKDAYAFELTGLRQGTLVKDPFAPDPILGEPPVLTGPVLTWPVHDGDVGAKIASRWLRALGWFRLWQIAKRFFD